MIFFSRQFAALDTALRQGKHLSRHDYQNYEFVVENFADLERFYAGYQCRLIQHPDGFIYLLPRGDLVPVRRLPVSAMHLGQFIALKCRDPELTRSNGRLSIAALIADLETTVPAGTLSKVYGRTQKETLSGERVHEEVRRALRLLIDLQFVVLQDEELTPTEAIGRFMELARHGNKPDELGTIALVNRGAILQSEASDLSEAAGFESLVDTAESTGDVGTD